MPRKTRPATQAATQGDRRKWLLWGQMDVDNGMIIDPIYIID
jgi:hypothetical protein